MGKNVLMFGDNEIEKQKSHRHENSILLEDIDGDKTFVSRKISFCEKNYNYNWLLGSF